VTLFWRIFLSFWLGAIILAGGFFLLGRFSSTQIIDRESARLQAQAGVVAALWNSQNGISATSQWLRKQAGEQQALLLNKQGQIPFMPGGAFMPHRMPGGMKMWRYGPINEGVEREESGRVTLAAALPGVQPELFLVRQLLPSQLDNMSMPAMLLLSFVTIVLVSFLLAAMLVRRIRILRKTVQGITGGDLSARVDLSGHDEVSALAEDFNRMADRIDEMMSSQRQLVSDVSHELRSPLARLRIALELAERAEDPRENLRKIGKEADELEQLVSGLLSLARMESGQSVLEKRTVDLCQLIRKIIEDANFEGEAQSRSVHLKTCDEVSLFLDPVLIHSAIENVIRNALHYTPDGTSVSVKVVRSSQQVNITIDDQGPGVPHQELARLFEPFTRVGEARDRKHGGFGLGLAITGKTLLAHEGTARAENRREGGLRVTLSLPVQDG